MPEYTELVTKALVRPVELPLGAGTLALITLDNGFDHTKPNTFGPQTLALLDTAIDEALAVPGVDAIAVTGKPFILAAGADLKGITSISERAQAEEIAKVGHRVFRRLSESAVPSFAYVNGLALGGGMEIALNCTYRTASRASAGMGLPECFIGLLPGWGGNWLVPNIAGPEAAVKVIVENALNSSKMLKADDAVALGLFDAAFDGADFLEQSLQWTAKVLRGEQDVQRPEIDRSEQAWESAVDKGRALARKKTLELAPNVDRALDLISAARTSSKDEGFAAEDEALADLIMSDTTRANLYAFDLVQRRAKKPAGAPDRSLARDVTKVGVVGAGLMASQLALLFARRLLVPVVITDLDQDRIDKGLAYVHAEVDKLHGKGRINGDMANRIKALVTGTTDKAAFADADFVIEAVFERIDVKKQVFAELEEHVKPDCVLATNTSSLSVTAMAEDLQYPERVVGFHFFTPVAAMPLLEIAPAERTDDPSLATAFAVGKGLKKSLVWSKDTTAFVVNRLLVRALAEALAAVDEGTPFAVVDRAAARVGMPMPPFVLLQMVGPAVALHTNESLHESFPERFPVSPGFQAVVSAGKTAIYRRDDQGRNVVDPEVADLWQQGERVSSEADIAARISEALAVEADLMISEGVVQAPMDIDMSMLLGAGFAFPNGGLLPYLDRAGVSERVLGKRFLPPGVASVA